MGVAEFQMPTGRRRGKRHLYWLYLEARLLKVKKGWRNKGPYT
jgi:hypothetical protein